MGRLKLLSKKAVDVARAKERQQAINEGAKLASRVDGLRELAAKEETGLQEFRINTLTALQAEIDPKIQERDALLNELIVLRDERKALLKPLDDEWAKARAFSLTLDDAREELTQEQTRHVLAIDALKQREKAVVVEANRVADERARSTKLLADAAAMNKSAATELMDARGQAQALLSNAQAVEAGTEKRERAVTVLEGLVEMRRLANEREMVANNEERIRLRDAYATLERIKSRLK